MALLLPRAIIHSLANHGFLAMVAARSGACIEANGEVLSLIGPPLASALAALYVQERMLQLGLGT